MHHPREQDNGSHSRSKACHNRSIISNQQGKTEPLQTNIERTSTLSKLLTPEWHRSRLKILTRYVFNIVSRIKWWSTTRCSQSPLIPRSGYTIPPNCRITLGSRGVALDTGCRDQFNTLLQLHHQVRVQSRDKGHDQTYKVRGQAPVAGTYNPGMPNHL